MTVEHILIPDALFLIVPAVFRHKYGWGRGRQFMVSVSFVNERSTMLTAIKIKNQVFTNPMPCKLMVRDVSEKSFALQGGSNMTGTDLCVNKPHCAVAVRP